MHNNYIELRVQRIKIIVTLETLLHLNLLTVLNKDVGGIENNKVLWWKFAQSKFKGLRTSNLAAIVWNTSSLGLAPIGKFCGNNLQRVIQTYVRSVFKSQLHFCYKPFSEVFFWPPKQIYKWVQTLKNLNRLNHVM